MSVRFTMLLAIGILTGAPSVEAASTWSVRPSLLPVTLTQSTSPIKVQTYSELPILPNGTFLGQVRKLKLLSVTDSVEILSITLNRGNCAVNYRGLDHTNNFTDDGLYSYLTTGDTLGLEFSNKTREQLLDEGWTAVTNNLYKKPGITLKYGDTREFSTSCKGEVLEIVIKTTLGDFKF